MERNRNHEVETSAPRRSRQEVTELRRNVDPPAILQPMKRLGEGATVRCGGDDRAFAEAARSRRRVDREDLDGRRAGSAEDGLGAKGRVARGASSRKDDMRGERGERRDRAETGRGQDTFFHAASSTWALARLRDLPQKR